jgi:hypothetical protein
MIVAFAIFYFGPAFIVISYIIYAVLTFLNPPFMNRYDFKGLFHISTFLTYFSFIIIIYFGGDIRDKIDGTIEWMIFGSSNPSSGLMHLLGHIWVFSWTYIFLTCTFCYSLFKLISK